MRLHRFIGNFNLDQKSLLIKDSELINQVRNVFRLNAGNSIILSNGKAEEANATILNFKNGILVELAAKRIIAARSNRRVFLYASLLKGDHFEMITEKTTEIGVEEIIPTLAGRVVKKSFNRERMLKIIKEASEQSGRGILTRLAEPMPFREAIADSLSRTDAQFFCEKGGEHWLNLITELSAQRIAIFIGPEGGWSDDEKEITQKNNLRFVNLSDLTLKAETAAIASAFIFCG